MRRAPRVAVTRSPSLACVLAVFPERPRPRRSQRWASRPSPPDEWRQRRLLNAKAGAAPAAPRAPAARPVFARPAGRSANAIGSAHVGDHEHASDGADITPSASPEIQRPPLLALRVPSALASRYA